MSGKGNRYDNVAVETFFKATKAELIWRDTWKAEMAIFYSHNAGQRNTSMDFIICAAAIEHWAGKAQSLSKRKVA